MKRKILVHIGSLAATKTADGLIDPKLVLAWLLNTIGAPGYLIGLLVPMREAGSLLPQLLIAQRVERSAIRKNYWVAGSALQGLAAIGMAGAAMFLSGDAAAWAIVVLLAVLAVARSACSVSYKDVLARTVDKGARGRVSGTASTVSSIAIFAFAFMLATDVLPREPTYVAGAIAVAGVLWLCAAVLFYTLQETANEGNAAPDDTLSVLVRPLQEDPELQAYIAARAFDINCPCASLSGLAGQRRRNRIRKSWITASCVIHSSDSVILHLGCTFRPVEPPNPDDRGGCCSCRLRHRRCFWVCDLWCC